MSRWLDAALTELGHVPFVPIAPKDLPGEPIGTNGTIGRWHGTEPTIRATAAHERFEERAAILEFDAGQSRRTAEDGAAPEEGHDDAAAFHRWLASEYAEGLHPLLKSDLSPSGRAFVQTALMFVESGWAERALAAGWGPHELLRADEDHPWERLDRLGAAYLASNPIIVTPDFIELEPAGREPRRIRRWRGDGKGCWPWHALRVVGGADHG